MNTSNLASWTPSTDQAPNNGVVCDSEIVKCVDCVLECVWYSLYISTPRSLTIFPRQLIVGAKRAPFRHNTETQLS